jgi:oligopeptide transport system ATP-binding protein
MILSVQNLQTEFHLPYSTVYAVRNVSFDLEQGETLGIVGESGSGKTVLAHSLMRLLPQPPAMMQGSAVFENIDLLACSEKAIRAIRGNRIGMIFQDPSASFNPYMRIADQLTEPLMLHRALSRREAAAAAVAALDETGIADAGHRIRSFPHEFSGGMLQRAMIAMVLLMRPQIVFADEPTTALDVTVQAQLLRLMKMLRERYLMSIVFITHNLGIVAGFCDRVLVMYAGRILEAAPTEKIFTATAHPYTRALIRSVPRLDGTVSTLHSIEGMPPDATVRIKGCPFYQRCGWKTADCQKAPMHLEKVGECHSTACLRRIRRELEW